MGLRRYMPGSKDQFHHWTARWSDDQEFAHTSTRSSCVLWIQRYSRLALLPDDIERQVNEEYLKALRVVKISKPSTGLNIHTYIDRAGVKMRARKFKCQNERCTLGRDVGDKRVM
jgi:hypothetical protein